ncbi:hypothetical protein DACRYDRAFT_21433 [Dacryopinax primogenitus]|uniref:Uncharacterized protein n=1 Tax=Dacryopinax primogenitus (strain DJM 731) TaxID=1858805 RepID=M5G4I3_DACPD|nr:uncharacterized protein DACRYDRAFT_21433 [Dacryopinax primogenitus]EJU03140.1 hypothetical protein DACRYDRAFT_21433 [Dacryopinax primogenitus]
MDSLPVPSPSLKRKASVLSRSHSPVPVIVEERPTKKQRLRLPTPPPDKARRPRAAHRRAMSLPVSSSHGRRSLEFPLRSQTASYSPPLSASSLTQVNADYDSDVDYMDEYIIESPVRPPKEVEVEQESVPQMRLPPLRPLTNVETVRQWDFSSLASNPQFRHDLLLDPDLPFLRPGPSYAQRILMDAYWTAVAREVATGCTCTAFDPASGAPQPCCCQILREHDSQSFIGMLSGHRVVGPSLSIPARLPLLISECRAVLLSALCPPENPAWLPHPGKQCQLEQTEQDPLPPLPEAPYNDLDLPEYFRQITSVIVQNCAPIRDEMVSRLVEAAQRGDVVWVLRSLLDLGELMKMDLANFERPRLVEHFLHEAPSYETRYLYETLIAARSTRPKNLRALMPNTHIWLTTLPSSPHPPQHAWHRLAHSLTHFLLAHALSSPPSPLPETLRLSEPFINSLSTLLQDTFALSILFYHYRTLAHLPVPKNYRRRKPVLDYLELKQQILSVGPLRLGAPSSESVTDRAAYIEGIRSALLLVRTRADDARYPSTLSPHKRPVPLERELVADERFFFCALRPTPTGHTLLGTRARSFAIATLSRALSAATLTSLRLSLPASKQEPDADLHSLLSDAGMGMDYLCGEMRELGRRLGRLVEIHGHVWKPVYEAEGWL